MEAKERIYNGMKMNGFLALAFNLIVLPVLAFLTIYYMMDVAWFSIPVMIILSLAFFIMLAGYFSQEPNEARVMVFFGKYEGTFKDTGFYWVNPFMEKKKLSMRARNLDVEPIKVNDKIGNPILIGLVLVWKLKDTYKAMFDIDAQTMADKNGAATVNSFIPLSNMFGYATDLRSKTQGRGNYSMEPSHFTEIPKNIQQEIINKG